ncbi:MAG: methylated-DNA--[protein]-cysteine S-methyltransferase [Bacteroidetes bacterium]|nr:methylated-DNA--[protein]-cysteine S-methyltransferase [Bacteroidota bacterium]
MSKILVHTKTETPIGEMDILATDRGICLLEFDVRTDLEEEIESLKKQFDAVLQIGENQHTPELKRQLKEYFARRRQLFSVPTILTGTDFQKKVWIDLKKIPYGTTRSYKEQAEKLGDVKAIRAVAKANGSNKIAILIPCHRVLGSDGKLTGYAGGIDRKRFLLNLEGEDTRPADLFS